MSSETLEVQKREATGSLAARKLRRGGRVPAILYGHGEDNVNLSVRSDEISRVIQHGSRLLSLTGDIKETALLRDVQWDAFGMDVLHIDLTRVSQSEAVEVTLPVELHGEAPGSGEGGVLGLVLHELTIMCPANQIPDHIQVNISNLHLGQSILAGDVPLPEGAKVVTGAAEVVVHITKPTDVEAGEDAAGGEAEPEVDSQGERRRRRRRVLGLLILPVPCCECQVAA